MSGGFLSRWSRRKLAAAVQAVPEREGARAEPASVPAAGPVLAQGASAAPDAAPGRAGAAVPEAEAQLPAVESLSLSSDFTAFLKEEVSEALRRKALQKLFSDPHFNRMDGLDIYIDDYSQPDPIPPEMMAKLQHAREWLQSNAPATDTEAAAALPGAGGDAAGAGGAASAGGEPGAAPSGPSEPAASEGGPTGTAAKAHGRLPDAGGLDGGDGAATPDTGPAPLLPRQKAP